MSDDRELALVRLLSEAVKATEPHLGRDAVAGILFSVTWAYVKHGGSPEAAELYFRQQIVKLRETP